jgi:hypothetical protein
MDTKVNLSFLKLFNHIKGIGKPHKPDELEVDWLENRAPPLQKKNWNEYLKHYEKEGVEHPKVKYPVLFGKGDN